MHRTKRQAAQRGFTLVAVLLAMLLLSLLASQTLEYASHLAQREREQTLLRVGNAYVEAIKNYYQKSPGTVKEWPVSLDQLLDDRRFITRVRHLREIYPDPMTRVADWVLIRNAAGGIVGLHSRSEGRAITVVAAPVLGVGLRHTDWKFIYQPQAVAP